MANRLYVGNLPPLATEEDLKAIFGRSGTVNSAIIVTDESRGRRRRFGLVEMSCNAEAQVAIARLNLTQFDETVISVGLARVDQLPNEF